LNKHFHISEMKTALGPILMTKVWPAESVGAGSQFALLAMPVHACWIEMQ
jgi:hypothetical protein